MKLENIWRYYRSKGCIEEDEQNLIDTHKRISILTFVIDALISRKNQKVLNGAIIYWTRKILKEKNLKVNEKLHKRSGFNLYKVR